METKKYVKARKPSRILGIDIGVKNLVTTSNNIGLNPVIVKGGNIRSYNQYFNKQLFSRLKDLMERNGQTTSRTIEKMKKDRDFFMNNNLRKVSNYIIKYCLKNDIDTIVIGENSAFDKKDKPEQNDNFIEIPFEIFMKDLKYKCRINGINFFKIDEAFTSKASFLDMDEMPSEEEYFSGKYNFSGKRIERGLYQSGTGRLINADINAASNIIRKKFKNAFEGMELNYLLNPKVIKEI